MTRRKPETDCFELTFQARYPMDEPKEVALEDYARVLVRSRASEAVRSENDPAMVEGIHVCGLTAPLTPELLTDLEDFARDLATHSAGSGGLGWS